MRKNTNRNTNAISVLLGERWRTTAPDNFDPRNQELRARTAEFACGCGDDRLIDFRRFRRRKAGRRPLRESFGAIAPIGEKIPTMGPRDLAASHSRNALQGQSMARLIYPFLCADPQRKHVTR